MKFSIVTPAYNSEKYLRQTIESVLSQQGDFEIEYFIVDGGSTEKTIAIAEEFKKNNINDRIIINIISEKDKGMYDAINKGFAKATGDIYAWINSDDIYETGAFEKIEKVFMAFPEIEWLKGVTSHIEKDGKKTIGEMPIYNREWIKSGLYGTFAYFIQQDSVFWRSSLWKKAGPINESLKFAGDFDLWIKFAKHAPLWSLNSPISYFRKHKGQLSEDMTPYRAEQKRIINPSGFLSSLVKLFFWLKSKSPKNFERFYVFIYPLLFRNRMRHYIEIDSKGLPLKKEIKSYKI